MSDKPDWHLINAKHPKWVLDAALFNMAMRLYEDNEVAARAAILREIEGVRYNYRSPRHASPLQRQGASA